MVFESILVIHPASVISFIVYVIGYVLWNNYAAYSSGKEFFFIQHIWIFYFVWSKLYNQLSNRHIRREKLYFGIVTFCELSMICTNSAYQE
jgi:hypothetical protein